MIGKVAWNNDGSHFNVGVAQCPVYYDRNIEMKMGNHFNVGGCLVSLHHNARGIQMHEKNIMG